MTTLAAQPAAQLVLHPSDVWLFRDGKPFDAGSDHRAQSHFPPLPSVIQGALRSAYIAQTTAFADYLAGGSPEAVYAAIGRGGDNYGALALRGPFLIGPHPKTGATTRYYPLPADLIWHGQAYQRVLPIAGIHDQVSPVDDVADLDWAIDLDDNDKPTGDLWIIETALQDYVTTGTVPDRTQVVTGRWLFAREARVGLQVDSQRRAAQDALLYEAEFVRPYPGVGLTVSVGGVDPAVWGTQGVLLLGGERRTGIYTRPDLAAPPQAGPGLTGKFCLYLLTPTWFDGGWQPKGGDWTPLFKGDTATLRLRAAVVGRPLRAGGIDLAASSRLPAGKPNERRTIVHKPARLLVPAGSVYYFEATGTVALISSNNSLCSGADGQIGFGQVLDGRW